MREQLGSMRQLGMRLGHLPWWSLLMCKGLHAALLLVSVYLEAMRESTARVLFGYSSLMYC